MHVHVRMKSWERRLDRTEWDEIRSAMEDFGLDVVGNRVVVCKQGEVRCGGRDMDQVML